MENIFSVTCAVFNEEATQMACGYKDSAIEVWSSESIPCEARESDNLVLGHSGSVYGLSYACSNQCLLSSSEDGTGKIDFLSSRIGRLTLFFMKYFELLKFHIVRLWLLEDLSNIMIYNGHVRPVWDVAVQ